MNINRKGFTLVELLVTIVIVGLVLGLTTFGIISVVNNSKSKAVVLTKNNLKEAASLYSSESSSDSWKKTEDYDAFCVTIGELMNKGLLDSNGVIKEKNIGRDTFVIVKRNNVTLSITSEEIITSSEDNYDENNKVCTGSVSVEGEKVNSPKITTSNTLTDKIVFDFDYGSVINNDNSLKTITSGYSCLYGKSSSSMNKEGFVNGNQCSFENLEKNTKYYVLLLMKTEKGTVAAVSDEFITSDFVNPEFKQEKNIVEVIYDDENVQNPSYYFSSTIEGTVNSDVKRCNIDRNGLFVCEENNIRNVERNVWYKTSSKNIKITYPEDNNRFDIFARIYDKSNNYSETKKLFVINKYVIKFYKNTAYSVDGNTGEYVERSCISGGSNGCQIESPSIEPKTGYSAIGFNTDKTASISSLDIKTKNEFKSNIDYYAITKPNNYTYNIVYKSSSGVILGSDTVTYPFDTTNTISPKSFAGYTSPEAQTIKWNSTSAKTITFVYTPITYTINYTLNGGSTSGNPTSYTIETASFTLKNPSRTGYTFIGWTGSNGNTPSTSVTISKGSYGNRSYTANWKQHYVTIQYNVNGGSIQSSAGGYTWTTNSSGIIYRNGDENFFKIGYGENTTSDGLVNWNNSSYINISKTGYSVANGEEWKCLSGCSNNYNHNTIYSASDFCDSSNGDCTVILGVNWNENPYTYNIVYKSSTGVNLGNATVTYNYGSTNTISPKSFTGYTSPEAQTIKWDSTSAKTITFVYTPITYTISYALNGGSASGNPTSYTIETASFTLKNPGRTGYTFIGWTGSNGNTPSTSVTISKGSTGNRSYTANWDVNNYTYDIVYKSSSGFILDTSTVTYTFGTTNTISPKSFDGYTSPEAQTIKWDSTSAKTITFVYTPITYTISYTLNGGSASGNPSDYTIETATFTLKNPSKTGYTFTGWTGTGLTGLSTSVTINKGSTGDRTYTANWSANTNTKYVVKHWQQNIDAGTTQNTTNYTLKDTDNLTGATGASITPAVKNYTGFTSPSTTITTILADGSRVVNYYYTRNSYTVTLNKGTGISSVSGNGKYHYGKNVTIDATLSLGYKWNKWSGTHNTTTKSYTFTMPASDVSDTANANTASYTITYNLNDGSVSGNPTSYNVETETFTLKNPSKTGYTFTGWTGSNGSIPSTSVTILKGSTGNRKYIANWESSSVTINSNKFACESARRMAVYYVVSCTGSNCIYNTKNGLNSSYNFSLDTTGIPTWSINKSDYVDNVSDLSSMCPAEIMYINSGGANCRSSADSSGNVNNITTSLSQCTAVAVYRTTMQYSNGGYSYWYYPYENCYMHESVLTSSDPCNSNCKTSSSTCEQYCKCLFGIQYSGTGDISSGCTCCSTGGIYQEQCIVT